MVHRILSTIERFDVDATRKLYAGVQKGSSLGCSCEGCRNYAMVRPALFPASFLALLETLGIDSMKEVQASYLAPLEGAMSLYGGTYAFVADIQQEPQTGEGGWRSDVYEPVAPGAFVALSAWPDSPPPWGGVAIARLDFLLVLPWVAGQTPPAPIDLSCRPEPAQRS